MRFRVLKLLLLLLLATPLRAQTRPATVPHFVDEQLVAQRIEQLSRQGVREFVVYQTDQAQAPDTLIEGQYLLHAEVVTFFFWQSAGRMYGQKFTDAALYEPVAVAGGLFSFEQLDQLPVTRAEQANINFVAPVMEPRPDAPLVVLVRNGRWGYFELSPGTYVAAAARQRLRRQWCQRIGRTVAQAEPLFAHPQPYTRPAF
ncbi:hypothetical protein [Hymenobacter sp. B81]|uniref:hypothetical protein n=1 Tax=Hymenobacter sp. B81 TaxID=3344878 RepID=UPI0037DD649D